MDFRALPIGRDIPECVNCVVEISKDTNAKYEYDIALNVFKLDRCLISSMRYPASYGFIPQTVAEDGDPLDILIYNSTPLQTGTVVECRIVGMLDMIDRGVPDYKLLGIPKYNPNNYQNISDIDPVFLRVASDFFKHYKNYEAKDVKVGEWLDKDAARNILLESHERYWLSQ